MPDLPDRIDREALERILQRASELQAAEGEAAEGLTSDELLALGRDVGIPAQYLRQAILEERGRTGPRPASGLLDRMLGPAEVGAGRVVAGEPEAIERALLAWMEKHELLAVQRHRPGRIAWERLRGIPAALKQGLATFDSKRLRFMLARAELVTATVTPLEPGYCHVTLTAVLREARGGLVGGATAGVTLALAGAAVLVALNAWWVVALAPVPMGAGIAWGTLRRLGPLRARIQLGLERVLDHVEGAAVAPARALPPRTLGLLEAIAGEVRRALEGSGTAGRDPRRPPQPPQAPRLPGRPGSPPSRPS